jgi:hypothetical protein
MDAGTPDIWSNAMSLTGQAAGRRDIILTVTTRNKPDG